MPCGRASPKFQIAVVGSGWATLHALSASASSSRPWLAAMQASTAAAARPRLELGHGAVQHVAEVERGDHVAGAMRSGRPPRHKGRVRSVRVHEQRRELLVGRRDGGREHARGVEQAGGAEGAVEVARLHVREPLELEQVRRRHVAQRDQVLADGVRGRFVEVEAARLVAEHGVAHVEGGWVLGAHARNRGLGGGDVLGRRQVAGQHCVDRFEPAVGVEAIHHLAEHGGRDALAREGAVAGVVRQHHGRHRDDLVAERLQRRDDGREADRAEGDVGGECEDAGHLISGSGVEELCAVSAAALNRRQGQSPRSWCSLLRALWCGAQRGRKAGCRFAPAAACSTCRA